MALTHIHVLGQGAIGSMLTARAIKNALPVSCEARHPHSTPSSVIDLDNVETPLPTPLSSNTLVAPNSLVILPLKAYQILPALSSLTDRTPSSCAILLLHNGMLDMHTIHDLIPHCNVFMATTTHAAKRMDKKVRVTGSGFTQIGYGLKLADHKTAKQQAADISQFLNKLLMPVSFEEDIRLVLWRKLVVNAVINPLTAIYNVKNGALRDNAFTDEIVNIIDECVNVAKQDSIELNRSTMLDLVYKVIDQTAANHSSMHQDISLYRPTEINYINGYVVARGQHLGITTTLNLELQQKVNSLRPKQ